MSAPLLGARPGLTKSFGRLVPPKQGRLVRPQRVVDIPITLGARGTPLAVGAHVFFRLGLNGSVTVLTWSVAATVAGVAHSGAVTLDVQTGATLATIASIAGTGHPLLSAASESSDHVPTGWTTTTIADPSWLYVSATAVDGTLEVVSLTLRVAVSPR